MRYVILPAVTFALLTAWGCMPQHPPTAQAEERQGVTRVQSFEGLSELFHAASCLEPAGIPRYNGGQCIPGEVNLP